MPPIYRFYRQVSEDLEYGFYVEASEFLDAGEYLRLEWIIAETFEPTMTRPDSIWFPAEVIEIGPRLSIETPFSSNAVAICHNAGLTKVTRFERTRRYRLAPGQSVADVLEANLDRMTEQHYPTGIVSFETGRKPEGVREIDVIGNPIIALQNANKELGLSMDARDLAYYEELFADTLGRNPTDVELLKLGNDNSEHSRHWLFRGMQIINGVRMSKTLFELVQEPLKRLGDNNVSLVAFRDNAGVIKGFWTEVLLPEDPGQPSVLRLTRKYVHNTDTAETHNHPTGVAAFPGAQTGAGGRIRDNSAVGCGGLPGIGVAGYFVGNLFIPGYQIPGENVGHDMPSTYASPLTILVEGSNGVTSYGNEFGEPLTLGFTRSFGQMVDGKWREPRKPVLYSAGIGSIFDEHVKKEKAEIGMLIVRIGGPAYPIGVGGGSASSMMQGSNTEQLDYNSVQRGNAEMENRANRVIQACVEMGSENPISSIHDQGAGGPSNVLTELVEPLGGRINIRNIVLGDKTMSIREIWCGEYQEGYGFLIRKNRIEFFQSICQRERVNCEILGEIDGSGKIVVEDPDTGTTPVDLNLDQILTKMPQKTFESRRQELKLEPLALPDVSISEAIKAVFKLLQVGSKNFLTSKGDRSVGGKVAQQQCVGIAQIPIADFSVLAQSHFGLTGAAGSIGEQPIKMLINPAAGARMAVGEMILNMAGVRISNLGDIRCRANWMWAAKLENEGANLYDAAVAATGLLTDLGAAIDGGKDSLTMAARVHGHLVIAPGQLVMLGTAPVPNITKKVTPDIKKPDGSFLCLIDLGGGKNRLGGGSLAQANNQIGNESPDVESSLLLKNTFLAVQQMIDEGVILAYHDRSDGGLFTTVAEMCMASRCGFDLQVNDHRHALAELFNEELGAVIEVAPIHDKRVREICESFDVPISLIGATHADGKCSIRAMSSDHELWSGNISLLRLWWEETSSRLEALQSDPDCARAEYLGHVDLLPGINSAPSYRLRFTPAETPPEILKVRNNPRVAVLREEGTNGDREMQAACFAGGLAAWDVTMSDLIAGRIDLDEFQGIIFAGGFSFMDVLDSAKGWAATIRYNTRVREMFARFYGRKDTFSLGVCNGCQLMALLGLVPLEDLQADMQPRFVRNESRRFESRWVQVEVLPSPAILLRGMEGSKLGVWAAHGEGRLVYPSQTVADVVRLRNLAPLAFLDPHGNQTEEYPHNPNGSPGGITALCSHNGRHLAMMPHPERCFRLWQWPWMPPSWSSLSASPWLRMFQNARTWCLEHSK
ncbi:phosphoribosylformylglycinamidine synthase [Candidatus Parcubacteria bacterium]|nr:phosphoribosylformylglycinamidine synthase [Candidatus Parcubacteria bacterium]